MLTSAVATVSELQAQRRQGWDRAGMPDWARWWLSELAVENHELTGMERRTRIGDLLPKRARVTVFVFIIIYQERKTSKLVLPRLGWVVCGSKERNL